MGKFIISYQEENRSASEKLLAESQLITTSRGIVEVAEKGRGNAVLISHGSGGGYDMGLWLADLIGGANKYIAPSRFGYLRSPRPANPAPETQADLYAALLDSLKINSVIMVGLSAGGASALQFALRHPGRCRGLIMISAVSLPVPPLPLILRVIYPFMLKSDLIPWLFYTIAPNEVFHANGISRTLLSRIKQDQEKMRLLDALYHTTFPSTPRSAGMICDMQQLTNQFSYPVERITAPTLVIHAANDPVIPVESGEYSARTIPGAQFLRLEDGGHFACVTHREITLPRIRELLDRCET